MSCRGETARYDRKTMGPLHPVAQHDAHSVLQACILARTHLRDCMLSVIPGRHFVISIPIGTSAHLRRCASSSADACTRTVRQCCVVKGLQPLLSRACAVSQPLLVRPWHAYACRSSRPLCMLTTAHLQGSPRLTEGNLAACADHKADMPRCYICVYCHIN